MMNKRKLELLECLPQSTFIAGSELAAKLKISEKTCRGLMGSLMQDIHEASADIVVKKGKGYQLTVCDPNRFEQWLTLNKRELTETIPQFWDERISFVLSYLLNQRGYVKRRDLGELLYVSEKTISAVLKEIEVILQQYRLSLEKTTRGVQIKGTEFQKRQCILNYFLRQNHDWYGWREEDPEEEKRMADLVLKVSGLCISSQGLDSLMDYLLVMKHRMKHGFMVERYEDIPRVNCEMAEKVYRMLEESGEICENNENEIVCIQVYLDGNLLRGKLGGTQNFITPVFISRIADSIFDNIYNNYKIDLRSNLLMRMETCKHLKILDIRIRYGIRLENPLLLDIRHQYIESYMLAQQAVKIVEEEYGISLSEDETGYFALLFEMYYWEQNKSEFDEKPVILICTSDDVSSLYLCFYLKKKFDRFARKIMTCHLEDLASQDMSRIDYILSTVPVNRDLSVPIIMIPNYVTDDELFRIETEMKQPRNSYLESFFDERLFFTEIEGKDWQEVIQNICRKMKEKIDLPESFCDAVLQRERSNSTDFGFLAAVPHPCRLVTDRMIAVVAILKKPVMWERQKVQLVILSSAGRHENKRNTAELFHSICRFVTDEDKVRKLLENQDFQTFMKLLNK